MDSVKVLSQILKESTAPIKVLEIGPGHFPIINEISKSLIAMAHFESIDHEINYDGNFEKSGNHSVHFKDNFLKFKNTTNYNVIIDRLCWHEQKLENRKIYLDKVYDMLLPDGLFICEHSLFHSEVYFHEDYLLFDSESKTLFIQTGDLIESCKVIPDSMTIEKEILDQGFRIKKFICDPSKKVICNRNHNHKPQKSDPDHLLLVAEKNSLP